MQTQSERFDVDGVAIDADVTIASTAAGLVLFVHGSGSSRHSARNQFVAANLRAQGLGTVLIDLLTPDEERKDQFSGHLRFDIPFLSRRVVAVVDTLARERTVPLGLFGASTGAAAALVTAAMRPQAIGAVVSRGGRPDLAREALPEVTAPTLLIVGGDDREVVEVNRQATSQMSTAVKLEIVPGASHMFHEPGALEAVAHLAGDWFLSHLADHAGAPRRDRGRVEDTHETT
jgi:putative phosphoribosyl transferase